MITDQQEDDEEARATHDRSREEKNALRFMAQEPDNQHKQSLQQINNLIYKYKMPMNKKCLVYIDNHTREIDQVYQLQHSAATKKNSFLSKNKIGYIVDNN